MVDCDAFRILCKAELENPTTTSKISSLKYYSAVDNLKRSNKRDPTSFIGFK